MYRIVIIESNYVLYEHETAQECINCLAHILSATRKFSLIDELNRMQQHANVKIGVAPHLTDNVFANKFDIPLYFINLLVKDFGIMIVEVKE